MGFLQPLYVYRCKISLGRFRVPSFLFDENLDRPCNVQLFQNDGEKPSHGVHIMMHLLGAVVRSAFMGK